MAQTSVTEAADAQLAALATQNAEFLRLTNRYFPDDLPWLRPCSGRLVVVRQQRAAQRTLLAADHRSDTDDSSDAGSEASFASSRSRASASSSGSKSSRQQRRVRTPRLSSREGGPREEEYLCTTLKAAVPTAAALADTAALLRALVLFGQLTRARALQSAQEAFLATVAAAAELLVVLPTPPPSAAPVDPAPAAAAAPQPPLVPAVDWHLWWAPR